MKTFLDLRHKIGDHMSSGLPFVVYRQPNQGRIKAILQKDTKEHKLRSFKDSGFVMAPFQEEQPSILLRADERFSVDREPFKMENGLKREPTDQDISTKKDFIDLVDKGIKAIAQGDLEKVVLSRKIETKLYSTPMEVFKRLLDNYSNAFCYLWSHPKIGTWLGATPEVLLKCDGERFSTISLAGTQTFKQGRLPIWGAKEKEEQEIVTGYMMAVLGERSMKLQRFPLETFQTGNLLHLRTKITGMLQNGNLGLVIRALHPTPAVCGLPVPDAKKFILENENYPREFYTGYLGELNMGGTSRLYVNLRCAKIKGGMAELYVGGGITRDSNALGEWEETVAKSRTLLDML